MGVSLYPLKGWVFIHWPMVCVCVCVSLSFGSVGVYPLGQGVGVSLSFGAGGRNLWPTLKMESDSGGDTPC